ncbi:hypothetical protein AeMF1_020672 [Aphanomyces euteiches]|nr:hypothetical protein AeMF1_020672 [Aphanomyces euteiches]KAH9186920.1 hypothetical protein AeNC1_011102 [Aphanomyces euteiches]
MEQYGRPTRKRSNAPVVAFLHPASSKPETQSPRASSVQSASSVPRQRPRAVNNDVQVPERSAAGFAAKTQGDDHRESIPVVHKVRPSTASAVKASSLTYSKADNNDHNEADAASPSSPQQRTPRMIRPRTATATKSTLSHNRPPPQASLLPGTTNEERPDARNERPETVVAVETLADRAYMTHLREDIKCVQRLLGQMDDAPSDPKMSLTTKGDGQLASPQAMKAHLKRMLSESLVLLMDRTLGNDNKEMANQDERGAGCGADGGTVYLSSFLGLARRAEKLQKKLVSAGVEKAFMEDELKLKESQLDTANEQLILFKDTLAKARPP